MNNYLGENMYSADNLGNPETHSDPNEIFKRGSTTYYNSTKLFPRKIRDKVTALYSFVRVADNYVDTVPQDVKGFLAFKEEYYSALNGKPSDNSIITNYIKLSKEMKFEE